MINIMSSRTILIWNKNCLMTCIWFAAWVIENISHFQLYVNIMRDSNISHSNIWQWIHKPVVYSANFMHHANVMMPKAGSSSCNIRFQSASNCVRILLKAIMTQERVKSMIHNRCWSAIIGSTITLTNLFNIALMDLEMNQKPIFYSFRKSLTDSELNIILNKIVGKLH